MSIAWNEIYPVDWNPNQVQCTCAGQVVEQVNAFIKKIQDINK